MAIREQVIWDFDAVICDAWLFKCVAIQEGDTATEHANYLSNMCLSETQVSECYRRMGQKILRHDLLPRRQRKKEYPLPYDDEGRVRLTTSQCSYI